MMHYDGEGNLHGGTQPSLDAELWDFDRNRPASPPPSLGHVIGYTLLTTFYAALTFVVWACESSPAGVAMLTWVCFALWVLSCWAVSRV